MLKIIISTTFLLCLNIFLQAQENDFVRRSYQTAKILSSQKISVDGVPSEEAYDMVEWGNDFTVHHPNNGEEPKRQTQFKILYDQNFVYVFFKCLDEDPEKIENRLGRRDNFPGDWVEINFDSYRDYATAFSFSISASGVKGDEFVTDNGNNWDDSWNPIWYAASKITEDGWNAEIKIPMSQLRFAKMDEQDWGFNITRRDFRADERSTFQFIPQNQAGWVSNFARLEGFKALEPKRQIETQPYIVAGRSTGEEEGKNRFNAGVDGKIGLTTNISLDYSVNPDFGQVEADPSVLNIDGFEVFFQERRPFFIENANLFDFQATAAEAGGPYTSDNLFYSRRIGANPRGDINSPDHSTDHNRPDFTNILAASKISGKTDKGLSIGIMEAVTSKEYESFSLPGQAERERMIIEPLSNYFAGRLSKDINGGATQVGGTLTQVYRFIDGTDLENQFNSTATTGGLNLFHSWEDRKWQFNVRLLGSHIQGTEARMEQVQQDFRHYFQRPDADHLEVKEGIKSLSGHGGNVSFANYGGEDNISYQFGITWRSPGLELNDIGFLNTSDIINHYLWAGYRYPKPFSIFRSARINYNHYLGWTFGGTNTLQAINTNVHGNFTNYMEAGLGFTAITRDISTKALFGGPLLRGATGYNVWGYAGSDTRKKIRLNVFGNTYRPFRSDEESIRRSTINVFLNWQVNNAFSTSIGPSFNYLNNALQNVSYEEFDGEIRYVTGRVIQKTLSASLRLSYSFTPNLTLEYWGQPFISKGQYDEFKYISDPLAKRFEDRFISYEPGQISQNEAGIYHVDENKDGVMDYDFSDPNFNFMQFRSNAVLRWEYIPGSELYLVWSQGTTVSGDPMKDVFASLREDLFSESIRNNFLVKLTYRLVN